MKNESLTYDGKFKFTGEDVFIPPDFYIPVPEGFHACVDTEIIGDNLSAVIVPEDYSFEEDCMEAPFMLSVRSDAFAFNDDFDPKFKEAYILFFGQNTNVFNHNGDTIEEVNFQKNSGMLFQIQGNISDDTRLIAKILFFVKNRVVYSTMVWNHKSNLPLYSLVTDFKKKVRSWLEKFYLAGEKRPYTPSPKTEPAKINAAVPIVNDHYETEKSEEISVSAENHGDGSAVSISDDVTIDIPAGYDYRWETNEEGEKRLNIYKSLSNEEEKEESAKMFTDALGLDLSDDDEKFSGDILTYDSIISIRQPQDFSIKLSEDSHGKDIMLFVSDDTMLNWDHDLKEWKYVPCYQGTLAYDDPENYGLSSPFSMEQLKRVYQKFINSKNLVDVDNTKNVVDVDMKNYFLVGSQLKKILFYGTSIEKEDIFPEIHQFVGGFFMITDEGKLFHSFAGLNTSDAVNDDLMHYCEGILAAARSVLVNGEPLPLDHITVDDLMKAFDFTPGSPSSAVSASLPTSSAPAATPAATPKPAEMASAPAATSSTPQVRTYWIRPSDSASSNSKTTSLSTEENTSTEQSPHTNSTADYSQYTSFSDEERRIMSIAGISEKEMAKRKRRAEKYAKTHNGAEDPRKGKRNRKTPIIIIAIVAAMIGIIAFFVQYATKEQSYNEAEALMQSGDYKEAAKIFDRLNDYEDSENRYANAIYEYADELYMNTQFKEALKEFQKIPDYKNSQIYIDALELYFFIEDLYNKKLTAKACINKLEAAADDYDTKSSVTYHQDYANTLRECADILRLCNREYMSSDNAPSSFNFIVFEPPSFTLDVSSGKVQEVASKLSFYNADREKTISKDAYYDTETKSFRVKNVSYDDASYHFTFYLSEDKKYVICERTDNENEKSDTWKYAVKNE